MWIAGETGKREDFLGKSDTLASRLARKHTSELVKSLREQLLEKRHLRIGWPWSFFHRVLNNQTRKEIPDKTFVFSQWHKTD